VTDVRGVPREQRRRRMAHAVAANIASNYPLYDFDLDVPVRPSSDSPASSSANADGTTAPSENSRRAARQSVNRVSILDDSMLALFGERWAHLYAESNPSPSRDDPESLLTTAAVEPEFLPTRRVRLPAMAEPPYATSSLRSTQEPGRSVRVPARRGAAGADRSQLSRMMGYSRRSRPEDRDSPYPPPRSRERSGFESTPTEPTAFDGLGDRNRSLSPEGDQHWNTLLTTITPDPQPPSLGSSFASASALASAAASQDAGTNSSRTSFESPDMLEDSAFDAEPPCESGCEGSDTEGDEDDEENPLTRFPSGLRGGRRTYADVTRSSRSSRSSTREQSLEMLGGIDGMQRIVSNLARREDIPDEWWAEAGLSRTLSREASD